MESPYFAGSSSGAGLQRNGEIHSPQWEEFINVQQYYYNYYYYTNAYAGEIPRFNVLNKGNM